MSGIAGVLRTDGADAPLGDLLRVLSRLTRRGPDGTSTWAEGAVALGQTTLVSRVDTLREPFRDGVGLPITLVMDGRVDNRGDLRRAILSHDSRAHLPDDGALVAACYRLWGEGFADYLVGEFAIALWDGRAGKLLCLRDGSGCRPLYYREYRGSLAFASEEEALLGLPGVSDTPSPLVVAGHLDPGFGGNWGGGTWLKDLKKLAPGHMLAIDRRGGITISCFWAPRPREPLHLRSEDEYAEAFGEVFSEAVRCRIEGALGPASMLSGGIDSTIVAAFGAKHARGATGTATTLLSAVREDEDACVETRNINVTATALGLPTGQVTIPRLGGRVSRQRLTAEVWDHIHPTSSTLLIPMAMYMLAQDLDRRVVLDGVDGDLVTYAPHRYMADLIRSGNLSGLWREASAASAHHTRLLRQQPLRIAAGEVWSALAPRPLRRIVQSFRAAAGAEYRGVLSSEFRVSIDFDGRMRERGALRRSQWEAGPTADLLGTLAALGSPWSVDATDLVAARQGVDRAHPWLDRRVIDFFVSLPVDMRVRNGWTKFLPRRSAAAMVHPSVAWSSGKDHLGAELASVVMQCSQSEIGNLIPVLDEFLGEYVDLSKVRKIISDSPLTDVTHSSYTRLSLGSLCGWRSRLRGLL